ncbi:MAG: 1-acyl-sn-glycerol-3-phosphate acyltransferase [Bordetella sp.]|nr:MAG: 1-acyl-sn-glycerol-3-phosphate acyltransferase [Bordetella sp.]
MIYLRSFLYSIFLIFTSIFYSIVCIVLYPFISSNSYYKLISVWTNLALWGCIKICKIRWKIRGMENLPNKPVIILSNHQSVWETLFFLSKMPKNICYVYKQELHWIPFFGWGLALLHMIPINRSKSQNAFKRIIQQGRRKLEEDLWIILFPEGKRMYSEEIGIFQKSGAFLSIKTQIPIIPVAHNSGKYWTKTLFLPGLINLSIGTAIKPKNMNVDELNEKVRSWIKNETLLLK